MQRAASDRHVLMRLVSTEFLADEEAARRMRYYKRSLRVQNSAADFTCDLLDFAGRSRRLRCVEVVLGDFRCTRNVFCIPWLCRSLTAGASGRRQVGQVAEPEVVMWGAVVPKHEELVIS